MSMRFGSDRPRIPGPIHLRYDMTADEPVAKRPAGTQNRSGRLDRVLLRDGHVCRYCGVSLVRGVNATMDHVIPKSRGGSSSMANLAACCMTCNFDKGNHLLDEWTPPLRAITHVVRRRRWSDEREEQSA